MSNHPEGEMYFKTILISIFSVFLISSTTFAVDGKKSKKNSFQLFDNVDVDIDRDNVTLTCDEGRYEEIHFNEENELFIDGKYIELDKDQKILVQDFKYEIYDIIEFAKEIGLEGAKIGLEGAKLGVSAVAKVFKLLSPYYDSEDLEEEMEEEAEELEIEAEKLEELADVLEKQVDELNDLREEMREEIPELKRVDWF